MMKITAPVIMPGVLALKGIKNFNLFPDFENNSNMYMGNKGLMYFIHKLAATKMRDKKWVL